MKLLFVTTPVAPINSNSKAGVTGIELSLCNIAKGMLERNHQVQIVAPSGSNHDSLPIQQIEGKLEPFISPQQDTNSVIIQKNAVLANMWDYAGQVQSDYDLILNFGHEWLPFYLSPFFQRPVLHFVCLSASAHLIDQQIDRVAQLCPGTLGLHTKAQASTFTYPESFHILSGGIDINKYTYVPASTSSGSLAWAGRITPEKGLEDAIAIANQTGIPLKIFGFMQNKEYWLQICETYPDAPIEYLGFLCTHDFQHELGQCRALLMTHKCVEAFGMVALEALACGVPVISYRRGGVSEIIIDGKIGWLVDPDNLEALMLATKNVGQISRKDCRQHVELKYSLPVYIDKVEKWCKAALKESQSYASS